MDKHDTILISCGSSENRKLLRSVLEQRYNLLETKTFSQSMLLLEQNMDCIAAVVLDITDKEKADTLLLGQQRNQELLSEIPVIVISRDDSPYVLNYAFSYGAADVIPLDYDPYAMLQRIENIVELHLHQKHLQAMVEEQANKLRHSSETMVDALSSIIEYRSIESGQHILRIRRFTKILLEEVARCCPEYGLSDTDISLIASASALHDIGKIAIPDAILMKPGPLTQEEREVMKTHAITGCQILDSLGGMGDPEYLRYAHNICHYHHERWDGGGYPEGISGDDIPICAQVVGLADVYDALTTKRVYKDAVEIDRAVNMILQGECGVFAPKLLECFKHVTREYEAMARAYADGMVPSTETFDVVLPEPVKERSGGIDRTRAKYYALVHYINAFLMEIDLTGGLFHVIYNPYPGLAQFNNISTLPEMEHMILDKLVIPAERERMHQFIHEELQNFIRQDLRRMTRTFRFRKKQNAQGELYEVTLLRTTPLDNTRKSLAVLCKKKESTPEAQQSNTVYTLEESTYICRNDANFTLVEVGAQTETLALYTVEEIKRDMGGQLLRLAHPEDRELVRKEFRRQLRDGTGVQLEYRVVFKDGTVHWILNKSRLTVSPDGQEYLYSFLTDITETKRAYDDLKEILQRYEIILAQTENVLFEWDVVKDTITFSETWHKLFGLQPTEKNVRSLLKTGTYFHPDDLPLLIDHLNALENGSQYEMVEVRMVSSQGRYIWCRFRASALRRSDGTLEKIVGIIINIDAEKQAQRQLQDRAERDSLTKLLNRNAAKKRAEEYLSRFPDGAPCALLIIDLDNFKYINDHYGHLYGDAILKKVAREIEKLFRNQDIVARIGGDEFMVLMRGVNDRNLLASRCQRLVNIFRGTFRDSDLPLSCSIGISMSPEHGVTYYDLFNHADQALYRVKAASKNDYAFYDDADPSPSAQKTGTAINNRIDSEEEPGLAEDNLVRYAFQRLYSSTDVKSAVNEILELAGKKTNVSRVYVFENSDDNRYCSNTYEWCNKGIWPEIDNLQNISYETDIPDYEDNFNEQGIFYCPDVSELPKKTYDIVAPQGIKSMLHCAIREGGVFRGYIGFDECVETRMWTKEEIDTLTYFSEMLSVFLLKRREQEKALRQAKGLSSILDNQNAWIYIIDPDSCELKYLNAKTRQLAPRVTPGMRCYRALMGKEDRCPGCPALGIRERKNNSAFMKNEQFDLETLAEATLIRWEDEESCLLTCREIPKEVNL